MKPKKGEKFKCHKCGLVVTIDNECGCEICDILCCSEPLKKVEEKKEE